MMCNFIAVTVLKGYNVSCLVLGRKIAIDASMSIYQFLIAVRIGEHQLTDSAGEETRYCVIIVWY